MHGTLHGAFVERWYVTVVHNLYVTIVWYIVYDLVCDRCMCSLYVACVWDIVLYLCTGHLHVTFVCGIVRGIGMLHLYVTSVRYICM